MWSKIRTTSVLLLISTASAAVMYYLASQMTFHFHDNIKNFCSCIFGLEHYRNNIGAAWLPRFFSNFCASLFVGPPPITQEGLKHSIGLYSFTWMMGINLLYVLFWGRRSVYFILGTLACVTFAYTWPIGEMVYPWDLPALFFFTLCVQLIRCRKAGLLIAAICIGTGFKEIAVEYCKTGYDT